MLPDIDFCKTVSLICNGPLKFLWLGSKIIQVILLILNALRTTLSVFSSAHRAFKIWRELLYLHHEGRLCCSKCPHDIIEQLPPYLFYNAHWATPDVLNAQKATLGSSMMLLEQQKMRQTRKWNQPRRFTSPLVNH
jgi:hypothetical protein